MSLQTEMRRLWTDHVMWTRLYLIDAIAGLPGAPFTARRLLQNQSDIGNAIRPFYGQAAANQLTSLLQDHIEIAVAIVAAAMAGDTRHLAAARSAWYVNADQIARFLAAANPNLPFPVLQQMMRTHLDQTFAEASARLSKNWDQDIRIYDEIVTHILNLADALSAAITKQFK